MSHQPSVNLFLPYPVSVNRMYRAGRGRVYKSDAYKEWIAAAHVAWLRQKSKLAEKKIVGRYFLAITAFPPDKRHRDIGNLEKSVSDFLQMEGIIENDSLATGIMVVWADPPHTRVGVSITVQSAPIAAGQGTGAEV